MTSMCRGYASGQFAAKVTLFDAAIYPNEYRVPQNKAYFFLNVSLNLSKSNSMHRLL